MKASGFLEIFGTFCGIESVLTVPDRVGTVWHKHNLQYRSRIEDLNGKCLSQGYLKFFNYGEQPLLYPPIEKARDYVVEEKMDGSCVICDYVNGVFSMRTRGIMNYITQKNAQDFEQLEVMYPKFVEYVKQHPNISFLLELITPNNVIVIRTDTIKFVLTGAIDKDTCTYKTVSELNEISRLTSIPRPEIYQFDNINDVVEQTKLWRGREGVVIAYANNQHRVKVKSKWYITCHSMCTSLRSEDSLLELYIAGGEPNYMEFFQYIEKIFDFEIASFYKNEISRLVDKRVKVDQIIDGMKRFVDSIRHLPTRREQAMAIISSYGDTSRTSMVFNILDNVPLTPAHKKKLYFQVMKHNG